MWFVQNQSQFAVGATFVQDATGAKCWVVAVKGTFTFDSDGRVVRAADQVKVCRTPVFAGDVATSSLREDCDLVPSRPGTDVVLHATAYAPGGRPAPAVDAAVRVGPVVKRLRVVGDRRWEWRLGRLGLSRPMPFTCLPIEWERTWGGSDPRRSDVVDPRNPAGVGHACHPEALVGRRAPNVESPETREGTVTGGVPAGLGPIASHWYERRRHAGTFDETWARTRRPLPPRDFSDAFHRTAPPDQQVAAFLCGGEDVVLWNLVPAGAARFRLPRPDLRCLTLIGHDEVPTTPVLHTVCIEPDARRLVLVWHTAVPCEGREHLLQQTIVAQRA
jgi:hypothetical protein